MFRTLLITLFASLGVSTTVLANPENKPDFATTKQLAEQGDAKAQYELGRMYYFGSDGVEKDNSKAIFLQ